MVKIKQTQDFNEEEKFKSTTSSFRLSKSKRDKDGNKKRWRNSINKNKEMQIKNGSSVDVLVKSDAVTVVKKSSEEYDKMLDVFCVLWNKYKRLKCTIFAPGDDWTSELIKESSDFKPIPLSIRKKLKDHAKKLYQYDKETYRKDEEKEAKGGDKKFQKTMISHGTSRDKIAALILQCMESPVHTLHFLHQLFNYATPKERHHTEEVLDHLYKILNETYFPNAYVVKEFECHDFNALIPLISEDKDEAQKQLLLWYFEDQLLIEYLYLLSNLRELTHDQLAQNKSTGINALMTLITNHPHQCTEVALRELVDKLGDVVRKTAGQVNYHLAMLQMKYPDLKLVMVAMVEELLYRANISKSAQYYSLIFLRDMKFNRGNHKLAERMVSIYFDFFKSSVRTGDVDSKFMAAILSGLNRAFPHLGKERSALLDDQINILYKICHLVKFNIAVQALHLLYQVQGTTQEDLTNRFYQCVYAKILDPGLGSSASISGFLNLVFKCISRDSNLQRVRAYIKRLLQVSKYQSPHVICAILYLISEAAKDNSLITDLYTFLTEKEEAPVRVIESDEEDEVKPDIDSEEDLPLLKIKKEKGVVRKPSSSWVHRSNVEKVVDSTSWAIDYNPAGRNPEYCGAHLTIPWELEEIKEHYHPSVSLFSTMLLEGRHVDYTGNPLLDFTFTRFLDRFIKRNPKQITRDDLKKPFAEYKHRGYIPHGVRAILVSSENFVNLPEHKVPAEDKFYHKFCTVYESRIPKRARGKVQYEDVSDEEFDEYLQKTSGLDEEEADFAQNAVNISNKANMDPDEDEDDADFSGGSDEEMDDGPSFGADDALADEHAEYEDFSDLDDLNFSDDEGNNKKAKNKNFKKGKLGKKRENSEFDTDDFDQILESNAYDDPLSGTSHAVSTKDKAGLKQLKWEEKRSDFMKHGDRRGGFRGNSRGPYRGSYGNSRGSFRGASRGSFRGSSRESFRGSSRGSFRGSSRGSFGGNEERAFGGKSKKSFSKSPKKPFGQNLKRNKT